MKAMVMTRVVDMHLENAPLRLVQMPDPVPQPDEVLITVSACGVCHTELDEIEGRTPPPVYPMVPGHQVIGRVALCGERVSGLSPGDRIGVAWIYDACGRCEHCRKGLENLCAEFRATGRDVNGGYAELMTVRADFAHPVPDRFSDAQAAPLLCAGAIGYRSLQLTGLENGQVLGLTGFGASAHLVLKMVRHRYADTPVYVFARSPSEQRFALELGAAWAGHTNDNAPQKCHAIIDTTPAWRPVVAALRQLGPGGRLVINAIRKEAHDTDALQTIDYATDLWLEKEVKSVANVTRADVRQFLSLAAQIPIVPEVEQYPLQSANTALAELKARKIRGAKVLQIK